MNPTENFLQNNGLLSTCCGKPCLGEYLYKIDDTEIGQHGICSKCRNYAEFLSDKEFEQKYNNDKN